MQKNNMWWILAIIVVIMFTTNNMPKKTAQSGVTVERIFMTKPVGYGEEVEVLIKLNGAPQKYFMIFRDTIPSGWKYVSGGGAQEGAVKGFITSILTNEFRYKIMAPLSAANITPNFTGTYQFADDAELYNIIGESTIEVVSRSCSTQSDCQTGTTCKNWMCFQGACKAVASNEGTSCTVNSVNGKCTGGVCVSTGPTRIKGCEHNSDCDDSNSCTTDICTTIGSCIHNPIADGTSCGTTDSKMGKCKALVCIEDKVDVPPPPVECQAWQVADGDTCKTAPWVVGIGVFIGGLFVLRAIIGG